LFRGLPRRLALEHNAPVQHALGGKMIKLTRSLGAMLFALATSAGASSVVDLDDGAALARLASERPEHYARVVGILRDAQQLPEKEVLGWLRTSHRAEDAAFGPAMLTSYPPQRRLSFSLDTVQYRATVVVVTSKPQIVR
jgi:hypothetical protein